MKEQEIKTEQEIIEESIQEEQTTEVNQLSEVDQLKQENAELNDKYLRLYADKENMQRRYSNELSNQIKYRDEYLAKDLLQVLDDFERCLSSIQKQEDSEGVVLIYNKLINILKQHNIEQIIPAEGDEFTTDTMEAVATIPNEENAGKVVACTQYGYKFPERVIRYAKVVVGQ